MIFIFFHYLLIKNYKITSIFYESVKDKKKLEAETKLRRLENELRILLTTTRDQQRIIDCKHNIQKQRQILQNIRDY